MFLPQNEFGVKIMNADAETKFSTLYFTFYFGRPSGRPISSMQLRQFALSLIAIRSSLVSFRPVSSSKLSMKVLLGAPLLRLPSVGSHNTRLWEISSGCLMQCPANRILRFLTFVDTGGRFW